MIAFDSKGEQAAWATGIVATTLAAARRLALLSSWFVYVVINPIVTDVYNATRVKKWIAQVLYKGRSCELTVDSEEGFLVNMIRTIIMMEHFGDYDS